jgi:hypothetical protein
MRRFSILVIFLGLISLLSVPSQAQRSVGGHILTLDDGSGHLVNITVPAMTGPGPYSWVLPITPGGSALTLPTPTVAGSILYSNGSNSWLENTNVIATNTGDFRATSINNTPIGATTPNSGAFTFFTAINAVPNGSTAQIYNTSASAGTGQTGLTLGATGAGSLQNVGLQFSVSGAAANNNYDILGSGGTPSWSVTSAGTLSVAGTYQIGGSTVLTNVGTQNIFVGVGAGSANGAGTLNTALGYNASVGTGNLAATAIGDGATANGNNTTALGEGANANFNGATALGVASALAPNAIAIGYGATSNGAAAIAIGFSTTANDNNSIAIGNNINLFGSNLIQLGNASVTQVITYGGIRAAGAITSLTAAGGLVLGAGAAATTTTLTSTATSARAISFPNAAGTLGLSGGGATGQFNFSGLTQSSNSTTAIQVGMGAGGASITPSGSGKVLIIISGLVGNNTVSDGTLLQVSYGTGGAPTFGTAATGTAVGTQVYFTEPAGGVITVPFSTSVIVTGLAVGTTYWIDLQMTATGGGSASVGYYCVSAMEMP